MRVLIFLFTSVFFLQNSFAANTLDIAVEAKSIKAEYFSSSKQGIIHVKGCEQCQAPFYKFKDLPLIIKEGKPLSFDSFMDDYWNAKFPTLILDLNSKLVLQIIY